MKTRTWLLITAGWSVFAIGAHAAIGNAWHIPDNTTDLGGAAMRSPEFEIGPSTPITITQGVYLGDGANQTGGWIIYRGIAGNATGAWSSVALTWRNNAGSNQYWSNVTAQVAAAKRAATCE